MSGILQSDIRQPENQLLFTIHMDLKALGTSVQQIATEKGISVESVVTAIESALAAAYKKEYRKRSEIVRAKFNPKTGNLSFTLVKTIVDPTEVRIISDEEEEDQGTVPEGREGNYNEKKQQDEENEEEVLPRYNPDRHIFLEEAKKQKKDAVIGEDLEFPLEEQADFGRIAAQTAKQVILQGLREAERASVRDEFTDKEGEIVSGVVQRFERGNVFVDLGRAIGIMFYNEGIPGEHYRVGERLRFFVVAVQDDPRRPGIILSRAHPKFIEKLFELEVPEMADGIVEVKQVAREPGSRTKIAVFSKEDGIDPVGSAVGQRGTRVMAVTNELGNEKIDIVEWSEDAEKFIANSLSPAEAGEVEVLERRTARVLVTDDQLSLAIGKGGQNVRLAARLTGWKIDVRSQARPDVVQEGGVAAVPKEEKTASPEEPDQVEGNGEAETVSEKG